MSVSGNTIVAPVSVADIQTILGYTTSSDVGTLCTCDKVQKWSLRKPVDLEVIGFSDTEATIQQVNPTTATSQTYPWYYGQLRTGTLIDNVSYYQVCGIKMPIVNKGNDTKAVDIINNYATNGCNWEYVKPTSYFRMTDFIGYRHDADSPFYFTARNPVYLGDDGELAEAWFYISYESEDNNVGMNHFADVLDSSYYPAVLIIDTASTSTTPYVIKSNEDIGDTGVGATFGERLSAGKYKAYFVLKSDTHDTIIPFPSTNNYPNPIEFSVVNSMNPANNPWNKLSYSIDAGGFAYSYTNSYFESFSNVGENDYATLYTNDKFCFYIDYECTKDVTIDFSKVSLKYGVDGGGGSYLVDCTPYINKTSYLNKSYSFTAGTTTRVYYQINDIYTNVTSNTTTRPSSSDIWGDDPINIYYNGVYLTGTQISIAYNTTYNGKFYSPNRGFYTSK